MIVAILIVCSLHLAFEIALAFAPIFKNSSRERQHADALVAVRAAEQFRGQSKGEEKVRVATQFLMDLHPRMKPSIARMLIENAVKTFKETAPGSSNS